MVLHVSSSLLSPLSPSLSSLSLMDVLLKPALTYAALCIFLLTQCYFQSECLITHSSETADSHVCSGFSAEGVLVLEVTCGVFL